MKLPLLCKKKKSEREREGSRAVDYLFYFSICFLESQTNSEKIIQQHSKALVSFARSFHQGAVQPQKRCDTQSRKIDAVQLYHRLFWSRPIRCRGGWTAVEDALGDEGGNWWWDSEVSRRSLELDTAGFIMISASCILALGLFSSALGKHQYEGGKFSHLRRLQGELGGDEERLIPERKELPKRSAGLNEQTCTALPGVESALLNDTSTVSDFTPTVTGLHVSLFLT